jgi:hypothetical protein
MGRPDCKDHAVDMPVIYAGSFEIWRAAWGIGGNGQMKTTVVDG